MARDCTNADIRGQNDDQRERRSFNRDSEGRGYGSSDRNSYRRREGLDSGRKDYSDRSFSNRRSRSDFSAEKGDEGEFVRERRGRRESKTSEDPSE